MVLSSPGDANGPAAQAEVSPESPWLQAMAVLPFDVLDALDLPATYERSFKLRPGVLLAQRYLLGVPTPGLAPAQLLEVACRLGMPPGLQGLFQRALEGASTALYGFEGGPDGLVFKAYAEYRARLGPALAAARAPGGQAQAVEMFRGFKWRVDIEDAGVQTVYTARPGLAPAQLPALVDARLRGARADALLTAAQAVLGRALAARPGYAPLWLDLGEAAASHRAFDLNLYDAGLRVLDIAAEVAKLAQTFGIDGDQVQGVLAAAGPGLLGHVSAGQGRDGEPYLTVYFEP